MRLFYLLIICCFAFNLQGQVHDSVFRKSYNRIVARLAVDDTTGLLEAKRLMSSKSVPVALSYSFQGYLASLAGDYETACNNFTKALQANDTLSDAILGRAIASGRAGLFEQARRDLSYLIDVNKKNPYLFKLRGIAALEMINYKAAGEDFVDGLKIDPTDAELNYLLAMVNYKTDRYREAYSDINKALATDSLNAQYYYLRGSILMALEKYREALADFNYALTIRPEFSDALTMKGYLFYRTGDTDQALITLKLATDTDPDFALPWFYTGLCQVEKELPADALRSFDRASRLGYDDGDIYHYRGLAYIQLRRYNDACKSWKDAVLRGYRLSKALSRRYCQP